MKINGCLNIHIKKSIAVGHAHKIFIDVFFNLLYARARHRVRSCVSERHLKILLAVRTMACNFKISKSDGEVVIHRLITEEIFFDHVALVAEAQDKFLVAVMGIHFHDVPENGFATDEHHGLGLELGFFPQTRSLAATEDDDFHNGILSPMRTKQLLLALGLTLLALLFIVFLGVRQYGGNVSALLRMDVRFGAEHHAPQGIVLYKDAGYDGMLYYQVARDIPALFSGQKTSLDSPYRFQRILLPLFVYVTTFGNDRAFPYAFLLLNLTAAIGALALTLSMTKKLSVHAFTIVANPAVLIGILFSLTEPLSLFFVVLFFFLWERNSRKLHAASLGALMLSLLARETTVFLIGLLFLWSLWRRQWREILLLIVPVLLFALWQYFLILRLGSVPFHAGGTIVNIPLKGLLTMLHWLLQDTGIRRIYRLSSLGLLLFLAPLCASLVREWMRKKTGADVLCFLLSGLSIIMLMMHAHIWGVITSIGRVIAPIYPVFTLYAAARDTWVERSLSTILIAVSVIAALGIVSIQHPFSIS